MKLANVPPPLPMPRVRAAMPLVEEAKRSLERGLTAWNDLQLHDALDSAEKFIRAARSAMIPVKRKRTTRTVAVP